jgi:hypothetical protein
MGARLRSPSGATSTVSRWLTAEFLEGLDARVVTGRCLSYGEGITYWLVVEVVKQLGDVGERLTAENPQVAAAFGELMGVLVEPDPWKRRCSQPHLRAEAEGSLSAPLASLSWSE